MEQITSMLVAGLGSMVLGLLPAVYITYINAVKGYTPGEGTLIVSCVGLILGASFTTELNTSLYFGEVPTILGAVLGTLLICGFLLTLTINSKTEENATALFVGSSLVWWVGSTVVIYAKGIPLIAAFSFLSISLGVSTLICFGLILAFYGVKNSQAIALRGAAVRQWMYVLPKRFSQDIKTALRLLFPDN